MRKDPLEEALEKMGIKLEHKDPSPLTQMIASGVGSIAGNLAGAAAGLGTIGKAVTSLTGAVIGHVAVTYRVHFERREDGEISRQS